MPTQNPRPQKKNQPPPWNSPPPPSLSKNSPPPAKSKTATEEPPSSALSFSGEQVLFISSSDELHAHLLPHLKSWGLATTACHHPTAIRQDRLQKFQVVVLCGPKTSWKIGRAHV